MSYLLKKEIEVRNMPEENNYLIVPFPTSVPYTPQVAMGHHKDVAEKLLSKGLCLPNGSHVAHLYFNAYFKGKPSYDSPEHYVQDHISVGEWLWIYNVNIWTPKN